MALKIHEPTKRYFATYTFHLPAMAHDGDFVIMCSMLEKRGKRGSSTDSVEEHEKKPPRPPFSSGNAGMNSTAVTCARVFCASVILATPVPHPMSAMRNEALVSMPESAERVRKHRVTLPVAVARVTAMSVIVVSLSQGVLYQETEVGHRCMVSG